MLKVQTGYINLYFKIAAMRAGVADVEFTASKQKYKIAKIEKNNTLLFAFGQKGPLVLTIVSLSQCFTGGLWTTSPGSFELSIQCKQVVIRNNLFRQREKNVLLLDSAMKNQKLVQ